MKCKNPHCQSPVFVPVIELDDIHRLVGVKCRNCGARYSIEEIEIKKEVNREGFWNSVKWGIAKLT